MAAKKKIKPQKARPKKVKKAPARKTAKAKKKPTAKKSAVKKPTQVAQTMHTRGATHDHTLPVQLWRRSHYKTLREFWPFYLHEHSFGLNRILHFIGSTLGLVIFAVAIGTRKYWLIAPALASGYLFAWVGHYVIEKNRPATFKYPLKSFISDWRMWYYVLTGKIRREMERFGISNK